MSMQTYLRVLRKGWWIVLVTFVLGAACAALYTNRETARYASTLTFFVATPSGSDQTALSADQFAQHRAVSYALLLSSDRLGQLVRDDTGVDETAAQVAGQITGQADTDSVLLHATVVDTSPQRALKIANSVSQQFPAMVEALENRSGQPQTVTLTLVSGPSVGNHPISPKRELNLLLGLAAGLAVGVGLALLRYWLDTSLRSSEAVTELTGLPVLAALDRDSTVRRRPLVVGEASSTPRAERYRQLRTSLQFVDVDHPVTSIVVTSSVESEGKSTISANLAVTFAEAGSRVLLIEGDLRKPGVSTIFDLEDGIGLTNVLAGQLTVDAVLQPWGGLLTVLPAGPVPPNPAEMLGSHAMGTLLAEMRERFDVIVIDTPPLVPVTDAAVLAALADRVVLVVRHGKTGRAQVRQSLEHLRAVDARTVGVVVSMRPRRRGSRQSYQYYGSAGGSGPRPELVHVPHPGAGPRSGAEGDDRGGTTTPDRPELVPDRVAATTDEGARLPAGWSDDDTPFRTDPFRPRTSPVRARRPRTAR